MILESSRAWPWSGVPKRSLGLWVDRVLTTYRVTPGWVDMRLTADGRLDMQSLLE